MQVEYKVTVDVPNTENSVEEVRQFIETTLHEHISYDMTVVADKF